jgi:opacity protein-like surface antigen
VGGASVSGPISADFEIQTLLFNLWYDIDINGPITPYIGGGIGYGDVEFKTPFGSADDDGFAYQLGAGVKYAVNQQWHLDVGYRFKDILEIDIFGAPLGDDDLQSHSIRAAVTYKFN